MMMKSRLSIVILGVLVFLIGVLAGTISHHIYIKQNPPAPSRMSFAPDKIIDGIAQELEMDDEQKRSLRAIFRETRQEYEKLNREFGPKYEVLNKQYGPMYEEIHREYRPRFEAIRNQSESKIKSILKPDQRKKYEEFLRKVKSSMPQQQPAS